MTPVVASNITATVHFLRATIATALTHLMATGELKRMYVENCHYSDDRHPTQCYPCLRGNNLNRNIGAF